MLLFPLNPLLSLCCSQNEIQYLHVPDQLLYCLPSAYLKDSSFPVWGSYSLVHEPPCFLPHGLFMGAPFPFKNCIKSSFSCQKKWFFLWAISFCPSKLWISFLSVLIAFYAYTFWSMQLLKWPVTSLAFFMRLQNSWQDLCLVNYYVLLHVRGYLLKE